MKKANKVETNGVYQFRNDCMKLLFKNLKGKDIFKYGASDKKSLGVDFKIDDIKVKYKAVKNAQVNILFEVKNGPNDGWFAEYKGGLFKSVATELYYHIDEHNLIYVVDIKRVRDYIKNPLNKIEKTEKGFYGGGWGYMLPIDMMLKNGIIKRIINL